MAAVERNGHGTESEASLRADERAAEALLMGLRLAEGVDLTRIASQSGVAQEALVNAKAVVALSAQGLLARTGSRLTVTDTGMPLLDRILAEIVAI